jgi:transcriptional regulator GlxA family with amidase domain
MGTRDLVSIQPAIAYIQTVYPTLQYLITVCTGSVVVARAGVLDGRRATTNKLGWGTSVEVRPQVEWVKKARWVVDGNVWTSSGVSAGLDVTFAWVAEVFGEERAGEVARIMEYERKIDADDDPFAG